MNYLLTFVISFVVIYFTYYLIIISRKKGLERFKKGAQAEYFKKVYNLDFRKIDLKRFANSLSIVNSFVMSAVITVIEVFDSLIIKMCVGFVLIIPLMLVCYKVLGQKYKKEGDKNV